jgi:hypothetical protein
VRAFRGEVNLFDGNSGKKRQKLLGAGVVAHQLAARLEAGSKYLVAILGGQGLIEA